MCYTSNTTRVPMCYTSNTTRVPRIKRLLIVAAASVGLLGAGVAYADPQVCIPSYKVTGTRILNRTQILFYTTGKQVWLNTLPHPCSIDETDGFVWQSSYAQYCDNIETIRSLRTGETCMLGKFTPYVKPNGPS
jgi:hypothetical protein